MAPFAEGTAVKFERALENGGRVYSAVAAADWTVGSVVFGGFILGTVLNAATDLQAGTGHLDPVWLTTPFYRATVVGPYEVHVRKVRSGARFDNLNADVYQKNNLMSSCQMIFGDLTPPSKPGLTLPAEYKPICPLVTHPSETKVCPQYPDQGYKDWYDWAEDPYFLEKNAKMTTQSRTADGLTWATWMTLKPGPGEAERCGANSVAFFADHPRTPWSLLPKDVQGERKWRQPSLAITIEFKHKLPLSSSFAGRTFGVFGWKRFLDNGRWNDSVEVWSAPAEIGEGNVTDDPKWRENMVCVAVAQAVALMIPPSTNAGYASGRANKSKL